MLSIRLRRSGKKKQPRYRIVVADNRAPIYGKYREMIGHYNPFTKAIVLDNKKALDWLNKGAQPTNAVAKILTKSNIEHKSIVIKKFRAISKKELENQKAKEEAERIKIQADKEKAKVAFEQQVEAEKSSQPSSEEKLQEAAGEAINKVAEAEKPADQKETNDNLEKPAEDKTAEPKKEAKKN